MCLLCAAFAAKGACSAAFRTRWLRPCSPYLGGIALHVPALGKPILPSLSPQGPKLPVYLDRSISTPKPPSILTFLETVLARRNVPSLPRPHRDTSRGR